MGASCEDEPPIWISGAIELEEEATGLVLGATVNGEFSRKGRKSPSFSKEELKFLNSRRGVRWKLPSWSTVGAKEISGGAVKCVEIGKNTNGESTLLGRH